MSKNSSWQQQLTEAITDPVVLCEILQLDKSIIANVQAAIAQFPLRVPQSFLSRIEKGNPNDPLLRQVLPLSAEMQPVEGYSLDPLNESAVNPARGLLHKYRRRVLLTLSGACAVHCRYCFRRHFPYGDNALGISQWQAALDYIAVHEDIDEVILSGGDPLVVKDTLLGKFIEKLEAISHLKTLRIHTRLPMVIPDRITDGLVYLLENTRLKSILVLHSNHVREWDEATQNALLKCRGLLVLNQSVLLKGVNDSVQDLCDLSLRLLDAHVLPYYLHLLDPVAGAAHFDVSEETAKRLVREMTNQLPGYLVPKLVREVPGMKAKQVLW